MFLLQHCRNNNNFKMTTIIVATNNNKDNPKNWNLITFKEGFYFFEEKLKLGVIFWNF